MKLITITMTVFLLGSLQATTINIGTGVITNSGSGGGLFTFGGDTPGSGRYYGSQVNCNPCSKVLGGSYIIGNGGYDISGGMAYNGISYSFGGYGAIQVFGNILADRGGGIYTGTFNLVGQACRLNPACYEPDGGVPTNVQGVGIAELVFEAGLWPQDRSLLTYKGATFTLTPEPTTLLLMAFGLVALILRRKLIFV